MSIRRRRLISAAAASLAVAAATGLGLSGCAGPSASKPLTYTDSPLFELLGPIYNLDDSDAMREQERTVQKLVAACMAKQGFEYKPVDRSGMFGGVDDIAETQTEEWIAENGYGMSGMSGEKDQKDPNEDYVSSLSEAQQQAYYAALYGDQQATEDGTPPPYDPKTAGCTDRAYREANGGKGNYWEDQKFSKLMENAGKLSEKAEKTPQVKAAAAKWSECMADAGVSGLQKKSDAVERVSEKNSELYNDLPASGEGTSATPPTPDAAALKKFHAYEVKVALADFRCGKSSGYTELALKTQFDLEEKFIAENRAKLDELVETYGSKK